ncbi:MAG: hypothetical protein ABIB61_03175 [Candidatus Shapirobacteria bacterium]
MVAHDEEFKADLTKLSDRELQEQRLKFVSGLYNGEKGSRDNVEKEFLIQEIDIEREVRLKRKAEIRSTWAIIISLISIFISIIALLDK